MHSVGQFSSGGVRLRPVVTIICAGFLAQRLRIHWTASSSICMGRRSIGRGKVMLSYRQRVRHKRGNAGSVDSKKPGYLGCTFFSRKNSGGASLIDMQLDSDSFMRSPLISSFGMVEPTRGARFAVAIMVRRRPSTVFPALLHFNSTHMVVPAPGWRKVGRVFSKVVVD